MESQSQNPQSSTGASGKTSGAQGAQAQSGGQAAGREGGRTETAGIEQVSGLNGLESPENAIGHLKQLGELNSQTGAAGKAKAALASQDTPTQSGKASGTPEWQTSLQSTLKNTWDTVSGRVRAASPTQLALGAAAVGAAVWLGTRKRSSKSDARNQQSSADRWSDYPSGSDGSRSEGQYGRYSNQASASRSGSQYGSQYGSQSRGSQSGSQYGSQAGSQEYGSQSSTPEYGSSNLRQGSQVVRQTGDLPTGSQKTSGPASGAYGQSNETWQRPTDERWDD